MRHCRHHDPHIKRKLVGAALLEEVALEEHAGSFAELDDGARHALVSEGKMRRGSECDRINVINMADLVLTLRPCVLAGNDVAAQINGDRVF